jgi:hypothetical protein
MMMMMSYVYYSIMLILGLMMMKSAPKKPCFSICWIHFVRSLPGDAALPTASKWLYVGRWLRAQYAPWPWSAAFNVFQPEKMGLKWFVYEMSILKSWNVIYILYIYTYIYIYTCGCLFYDYIIAFKSFWYCHPTWNNAPMSPKDVDL